MNDLLRVGAIEFARFLEVKLPTLYVPFWA
jgi:hypothetical protein